MAAKMKNEFDDLVQAARDQGWEVSQTANTHYRLAPPDKTKPVVHIGGRSGDFRALRNSIAELRRSGLIWPPETFREKRRRAEDELVENAPVRCEPKLGTIADVLKPGTVDFFAPTSPAERAELGTAAYAAKWEKDGGVLPQDLPETDDARIDRLFGELKDAKLLAKLTAEVEEAATRAMNDAIEKQKVAAREALDALKALKAKKEEFAAAFDAELVDGKAA